MNATTFSPPHFRFWPPGVPHEMPLDDLTLWDGLAQLAEQAPSAPAVHFLGLTLSWQALRSQALDLAGALEASGVKRGDRVLLFSQNSPQFVITFHAVLRLGAVVVCVNPMNKARELEHCLKDSGARVAVASSEIAGELALADRALGAGKHLQHLVVFSIIDMADETLELPASWDEWLRAVRPLPTLADGEVHEWSALTSREQAPSLAPPNADDLALLMYTSGTTGNPKACMHSHRTIRANARQPAIWQDLRAGDTSLVALPMFHITGLVGGLLGSVCSGAAVALMPRWDRRAAAALIQQQRVTHWTNIPTMVMDLLAEPGLAEFDLSSLRYIGGGGASMPDAVAKKLKALTGLDYVEGYGLTETAAPSHCNPVHAARYQCLGIPVINTRSCIVDPETLEPVEVGEPGEIVVSGPQVFLGYWNNPQASEAAFIEREGQRWFRTGDLGRMDADGFYYIADRLKRMINASGFKVWPAEVEALLFGHPAVQEACVIARRDPYRGESVKAVVVLRPAEKGRVQPDDIIAWARENMAAYKVPREVEFVDVLPKGPTGKVMWRGLQERQDSADRAAA